MHKIEDFIKIKLHKIEDLLKVLLKFSPTTKNEGISYFLCENLSTKNKSLYPASCPYENHQTDVDQRDTSGPVGAPL